MLATAFGASFRQGLSSAAPMADKLALVISALLGVISHCNTAMGAGDGTSAGATAYEVVVASAVDEKYRLTAVFLIFYELVGEKRADGGGISASCLISHIGDRNRRKYGISVSFGQLYEGVPSLCRLFPAFERGSGGGKEHKRVFACASLSRNISCVVFRTHIGFVGVLLLLVDNDKSEIFYGGKYSRASAEHHIGFSPLYFQIGFAALTRRKSRVDDRDPLAVS